MKWIYKNNTDNTCRYVLGILGDNPLICFGINPSTAEPKALDNTINSVDRIAKSNGFDSWVMLNIYPQRATNSDNMDVDFNVDIFNDNLKYIEEILSKGNVTIWAAWGGLIKKRKYLKDCLIRIIEVSNKYNCKWVSVGKLLKEGHPHHPLFLKRNEKIKAFDISKYLK